MSIWCSLFHCETDAERYQRLLHELAQARNAADTMWHFIDTFWPLILVYLAIIAVVRRAPGFRIRACERERGQVALHITFESNTIDEHVRAIAALESGLLDLNAEITELQRFAEEAAGILGSAKSG